MTAARRDVRTFLGEDDYQRRMAAARRRSAWELGDPSYAAIIVAAFLYPDEDTHDLDDEGAPPG